MHSTPKSAGKALLPQPVDTVQAPGLRGSRPGHAARVSLGLGLVTCLTLAGCAVGPDFKSPAAPEGAGGRYTSADLSATTAEAKGADVGGAGVAQHIVYGQELSAQWWELFHSQALNDLIQRALKQNPTLVAAKASLHQAEETYNAESGSLRYPSVTGQLGANRQRAELFGTSPSDFNLYNATVNVSYTVDAFGSTRRQLESLKATVDYQRFEVEAAYQTLVSNVVTTAIREAALRAQLQATKDVLDAQQKQLDIVQKQLALGAVPRSVVLSQSTQVAQTASLVAPLEKSLAQTRHQLAVFVGVLPSDAGLPEFQLESLQLPQDLPVSLPSSLVRQRPDIQASEALLHQASANVGVATANQYPQITLTGSYGVERIQLGGLSANSTLWSLGAGLTQPLFNAGALSAKRRAAEAAYEQAEAQYRLTVLTAFQNVADSLRAVDSDATALQTQADAEALAKSSLDLSTEQYKAGATSYLALLDAERSYQQARVNLVNAEAVRYSDTAALFLALGGGWWNRGSADDASSQPAPANSK